MRSETWTRIRPFPDAPPTLLRGNEHAAPKKLGFKRTRECHRSVGERTAIERLCGDAIVTVVQAADLWHRDHPSGRRRRNGPRDRRVLAQREMRACVQVVGEVVPEHPPQPGLVRDDHVVQVLTSDRPDDALDASVLPGRARRCAASTTFAGQI